MDPSKSAQLAAAHKTFLDKRPHETFSEAEVAEADTLLKKELEVVKTGMGHGELSIDSYTQVWEECYAQVGSLKCILVYFSMFQYISFRLCISSCFTFPAGPYTRH